MTPQHRPPNPWERLSTPEKRDALEALFAPPAPVEPPPPQTDEWGRTNGPNPWTPTPLRGATNGRT